MSTDELDLARSEIGDLEHFLRELSEDRLIERLGFEHRLKTARERLANLEAVPRAKRLPITFRGTPVDGSRSIDATFATKAVRAFVEATDTITASLLPAALKGHGRLPGVGSRSLRIVDTALGSFGFELELPLPSGEDVPTGQRSLALDDPQHDPHERAIETMLALVEQAAASDEEAISDLIAEIHPRAALKVHAFAKVLSDSSAHFSAEFMGHRVRLDDDDDVQRVVTALKDDDISEVTESKLGTLLGVLPKSRSFEARLADESIVKGKVDRSADIPALKVWEDRLAELQFRVVSVRANRRFILTGVSAAEPNDEPTTHEQDDS